MSYWHNADGSPARPFRGRFDWSHLFPVAVLVLAYLLITLLSGCGYGTERTYAIDLTNGNRRCVVATAYQYDRVQQFTFLRNGQAVGTVGGVLAILVVDKCEEKIR